MVEQNFISKMQSRNLVAQVNHIDELAMHLAEKPRVAYMGFDPTADSLHVGHLLSAMNLKRWQDCGHKAIALMGGGTAIVGDPSDRTDMRKMLDDETINNNIECFKKQLSQFIDFSSDSKGMIVNNADWLNKLNYLNFLREFGVNFSVNRMLTAECFKQRLEKGLTFFEFNYMILQSYDFWELYKILDVTVQLGGDDQWSNMLSGSDLVRRKARTQSFCLTHPLLTTSDGKKMGKTMGGAVWLDPNKTSPYEFFQYFRNIEDDSVKKVFLCLTELPVEQVDSLCDVEGAQINQAKIELAYQITKFVHGDEEAKKSRDTASSLHNNKGTPSGNEPLKSISEAELGTEINIMDLLVKSTITTSKSEARRLITQGGLTIDDTKITDVNYVFKKADISSDGALVKKGKKNFFRLKIK